ncbi:DNA-3-methyladenine glycosylase family protein [Legionella maioricensis]|uniref:DNA-3-methyladenine glycosylase II n=1 Tax=Legionella maioricensis TaxID=2896528 RepID=A0A9X2ICV7_9GAMM|nr:DNA-3-methyladenine glycosylase [Legionella maioricensis]MCL9684877.1 DNA-3-methyladenine glycosylase [Legionella maioricensis]MCL9688953.1 DNA-3-methyladenine glycosylase [Legionella maioricensis]
MPRIHHPSHQLITISKTQEAMAFLAEVDPQLKEVIEKIGPMTVQLDPQETVFESLGTSILYQQLHGKAAAKILERLKILFGSEIDFPRPEQIGAVSEEHLMTVGLSRAKAKAIKDLAEKTLLNVIPDRERSHQISDAELIEAFCQVRGIGRWTVEMFLIFTLGRLDVLPIHDFGVRKGFMKVYHQPDMPPPKELEKYGERWHPFRTAAAWYLWRSLDPS